jgi:hypothetical protein
MKYVVNIRDEAAKIIQEYAGYCISGLDFGSMSPSIYDTAWVSMILKENGGSRHWLFPDTFQYVLDHQEPDGGWKTYADSVDGILNTTAALLSLLKHREEDNEVESNRKELLDERISRATSWLRASLKSWNVRDCNNVGFEILVPALLKQLGRYGIKFVVADWEYLEGLNQEKLAKFHESMVYGPVQTTIIHSLEAFVDQIDFDRVSHHLINGSLMGSPSATAAYMINSTRWDDEAERYLRRVAERASGSCFPSAYPTSIFETSWILSTLLNDSVLLKDLREHGLRDVIAFLRQALPTTDTVVGFGPNVLPDADDTAKTLQALARSGYTMSARGLVTTFYNGRYFKTYHAERNSSFSVNCNALMALLDCHDKQDYVLEIMSTIVFLCDFLSTGIAKDKWNTSDLYSTMLFAETCVLFLRNLDEGSILASFGDITERLQPLLTQIHSQLLLKQNPNGSWGSGLPEVTAYGVQALISILSVPWLTAASDGIMKAIESGRQYLIATYHTWHNCQHLWIEKVTCAMPNIAWAYIVSALGTSTVQKPWTGALRSLALAPNDRLIHFQKFFSKLPLFEEHHRGSQIVLLSLYESFAFSARFRKALVRIFPRFGMTKDKYLEYIPFTWTSCNNLSTPVTEDILLDMMILSALNFQVDEYMETVVGSFGVSALKDIEDIIHYIFATNPNEEAPSLKSRVLSDLSVKTASENENEQQGSKSTGLRLQDVMDVIRNYVDHVLRHPKVIKSSPILRQQLRVELHDFLLAHVAQIRQSEYLIQRENGMEEVYSGPSYYNWVHSTGKDNTSCPFSFTFYCCLISEPGETCFKTSRSKYLAQDLCHHLATMCRQYNDYGSIARDREEANLNSVDFDEFNTSIDQGAVGKDEREADACKLKQLFWLAEYERECLNFARRELEKEVSESIMRKIMLFVNVTDLYGQIYVARDIASRRTNGTAEEKLEGIPLSLS